MRMFWARLDCKFRYESRQKSRIENAMGERQELNKITKLFLVNSTISLNSTLNHVALLEILSVSLNLVGSSTFLHFLSHESSPHRVSLSRSFSRYRERLGDDWKVWKHSNTQCKEKRRSRQAERSWCEELKASQLAANKALTVKYHKSSCFSSRFDSHLVDFDCQVSSFTHSQQLKIELLFFYLVESTKQSKKLEHWRQCDVAIK